MISRRCDGGIVISRALVGGESCKFTGDMYGACPLCPEVRWVLIGPIVMLVILIGGIVSGRVLVGGVVM